MKIVLSFAILLVSSDLSGLVKKLGAPRYSDREDAAAELEKLGRKAMPALKLGREAEDAEIRTRASALYEHIETSLLTEPTWIEIDNHARILEEAVEDLSSRSGFSIHILGVNRENAGDPRSMASPSPEPFWTAINRLADQRGLDVTMETPPAQEPSKGSLYGVLSLQPIASGTRPAPSSVSGPFRVAVSSMTRLLERSFGTDSEVVVRNPNLAAREVGHTNDEFFLDLIVMVEPRMTVSLAGPVRVLQATDEQGNSMVAEAEAPPASPQEIYNRRFNLTRPGLVQASVNLRYPDSPGRRIRNLRGTIPLIVSSRKSDPLVINLSNSTGNTFRSDDSWITIHDIRSEPNLGQTTIDLSIRSLATTGLTDMDTTGIGRQSGYADQIEIRDDQGVPLTQWHVATQTVDFSGSKMSLKVLNGGNAPAEIRFHDLVTATSQADFSFENLPMP